MFFYDMSALDPAAKAFIKGYGFEVNYTAGL